MSLQVVDGMVLEGWSCWALLKYICSLCKCGSPMYGTSILEIKRTHDLVVVRIRAYSVDNREGELPFGEVLSEPLV